MNLEDLQDGKLISDYKIHTEALDNFLKFQGYERHGQLYKVINPIVLIFLHAYCFFFIYAKLRLEEL